MRYKIVGCTYRVFICIIIFILNHYISTNPTVAQVVGEHKTEITTLPQAINSIIKPINNGTIQKWSGGSSWTVSDLPWNRVIAISPNKKSNLAYLYTALEDSMPIALLQVQGKGKHYGYFKADPKIFSGWWIEASSSKNNGVIDRVSVRKKNENHIIVFNNTGGKDPQFVAVRLSKDLVDILPFDDSATTFQANVIYNIRTHSIIAVSNYTLDERSLSDIYVRNNQGEWVEYAYSPTTNRVSAIGLHGKIPGQLRRCLLDLTDDGKVDIQFGYSPKMDSLFFYSTPEGKIFNVQNTDILKSTMIESARLVTSQWNKACSLFYSIKALGYQFPKVQHLK